MWLSFTAFPLFWGFYLSVTAQFSFLHFPHGLDQCPAVVRGSKRVFHWLAKEKEAGRVLIWFLILNLFTYLRQGLQHLVSEAACWFGVWWLDYHCAFSRVCSQSLEQGSVRFGLLAARWCWCRWPRSVCSCTCCWSLVWSRILPAGCVPVVRCHSAVVSRAWNMPGCSKAGWAPGDGAAGLLLTLGARSKAHLLGLPLPQGRLLQLSSAGTVFSRH